MRYFIMMGSADAYVPKDRPTRPSVTPAALALFPLRLASAMASCRAASARPTAPETIKSLPPIIVRLTVGDDTIDYIGISRCRALLIGPELVS